MRGNAPFVVVLAAAAAKMGRSTLAGNLAVYLRGLSEDLPVAVISFDQGFDPAQNLTFAGCAETSISDLRTDVPLEEQLGIGQFGLDYLAGGNVPPISAADLRGLLRRSDYPGILIIDAGPLEERPAATALQAADLVLSPVRDAKGLAALARIRREMKAGGASDRQLWLLPSMIEDPREEERQLALLRFAASERGCQVLDVEYAFDAQLPRALVGVGGSVLTRMPGSQAHQLLMRLARLVLQKKAEGPDSACHLQRLKIDNALPSRFRRVDVICPLCQRLACFGAAHYCESLPQRKRWLVHADCLARLMAGRKLQPFWLRGQSAVLRTGVEGEGLLPYLRLLLPDADGLHFESELFQPDADSGWQSLVRRATGRTLDEQLPGMIMIYPALSGSRVLSKRWYRSCRALRKRLRKGLAAEL